MELIQIQLNVYIYDLKKLRMKSTCIFVNNFNDNKVQTLLNDFVDIVYKNHPYQVAEVIEETIYDGISDYI